jgi:hypothetical protein
LWLTILTRTNYISIVLEIPACSPPKHDQYSRHALCAQKRFYALANLWDADLALRSVGIQGLSHLRKMIVGNLAKPILWNVQLDALLDYLVAPWPKKNPHPVQQPASCMLRSILRLLLSLSISYLIKVVE